MSLRDRYSCSVNIPKTPIDVGLDFKNKNNIEINHIGGWRFKKNKGERVPYPKPVLCGFISIV